MTVVMKYCPVCKTHRITIHRESGLFHCCHCQWNHLGTIEGDRKESPDLSSPPSPQFCIKGYVPPDRT